MEELIKYAERRLNESVEANADSDILYWRAYLDGALAVKKEIEKKENDWK